MQTPRFLVSLLVFGVAAAGCTLSNTDVPPLAGPSELALSLAASVSPDIVSQDGTSQATLMVVARGPNGQAVRGVSLRLAMFVGGSNVDYGTLSTKAISTDNNGIASAIYTAPLAPPPTVTSDTTVDIQILPVGADFNSTTARWVSVRLARPGVIRPPNPAVTAALFYSPSQPREDELVQFDGSGSTGQGLTYAWTFGDGDTASGVRPTHVYSVSGNYNVVLTVTDDQGTKATTAPTAVSVIQAALPVASFTVSPTDPLVNTDVFVDGSASTVPAGRSIVSYEWNFGDGSPSVKNRTAAHKYMSANTFTIVLTVTDNTGRQAVASRTVQVK